MKRQIKIQGGREMRKQATTSLDDSYLWITVVYKRPRSLSRKHQDFAGCQPKQRETSKEKSKSSHRKTQRRISQLESQNRILKRQNAIFSEYFKVVDRKKSHRKISDQRLSQQHEYYRTRSREGRQPVEKSTWGSDKFNGNKLVTFGFED